MQGGWLEASAKDYNGAPHEPSARVGLCRQGLVCVGGGAVVERGWRRSQFVPDAFQIAHTPFHPTHPAWGAVRAEGAASSKLLPSPPCREFRLAGCGEIATSAWEADARLAGGALPGFA